MVSCAGDNGLSNSGLRIGGKNIVNSQGVSFALIGSPLRGIMKLFTAEYGRIVIIGAYIHQLLLFLVNINTNYD